MTMTDPLIVELTQEAATTRRVLERVPEDRLSWTPHPKSMSLGQLALHVAVLPGALAELLSEPTREIPEVPLPEATSLGEILSALDESVEGARAQLSAWGENDLTAEWRLTRGADVVMALPRIHMVRAAMFNHWYHHRGQLVVYLRLLGVPVPAVYGPSADEDPFGRVAAARSAPEADPKTKTGDLAPRIEEEETMKAEPQKEHEWLERLVGEWTYEGEATMDPGQPPEKFTGTESVRSLGGLWFLAEGRGEMPGAGEATTIMTLGYDPQKKRYVGTWIGSMMTHLWLYDGRLDTAERVLTLNAEGPGMAAEGRMTRYKDVIEFESDDHRLLTSHMLTDEGKWQQLMTAHYRRTT